MNYLIQQEQSLVQLRAFMDPLKNDPTQEHTFFSTLVTYQKIIEETQEKIKEMIEQGAAVNIQDCYGKSLLQYCKTQQFYECFVTAGAPFEIAAFAYFNQASLTKYCMIALPIIAAGLALPMLLNAENNRLGNFFDTYYENNYKK